jgi:hypothetical protein
MIVKYKSDDVWGYIDHVRQVATRDYDGASLISQYNDEVSKHIREDIASEGAQDSGVEKSNKMFLMTSELIGEMTEDLNAHVVNLVYGNEYLPLYAILLYLEDTKEYDAMVLITNQKCYLMNDEGKTIERLS